MINYDNIEEAFDDHNEQFDRTAVEEIKRRGVDQAHSERAATMLFCIIQRGVDKAAACLREVHEKMKDINTVNTFRTPCDYCHNEFPLWNMTVDKGQVACEGCAERNCGDRAVYINRDTFKDIVHRKTLIFLRIQTGDETTDFVLSTIYNEFKQDYVEQMGWFWTKSETRTIFGRKGVFLESGHDHYLGKLADLKEEVEDFQPQVEALIKAFNDRHDFMVPAPPDEFREEVNTRVASILREMQLITNYDAKLVHDLIDRAWQVAPDQQAGLLFCDIAVEGLDFATRRLEKSIKRMEQLVQLDAMEVFCDTCGEEFPAWKIAFSGTTTVCIDCSSGRRIEFRLSQLHCQNLFSNYRRLAETWQSLAFSTDFVCTVLWEVYQNNVKDGRKPFNEEEECQVFGDVDLMNEAKQFFIEAYFEVKTVNGIHFELKKWSAFNERRLAEQRHRH